MERREAHILLVDDNKVDVMAVERAFRKQRIANPIHVAEDGVAALEMIRDPDSPLGRPFLVLLDLNMPRMNGIEFLQAIRADPALKKLIVFVLTTSSRDEDLVASYDHNVAGYILKSEVGEGFVNLISLLDHYWRVVELPPEQDR
jgi:CheY-like chemotaxis protein